MDTNLKNNNENIPSKYKLIIFVFNWIYNDKLDEEEEEEEVPNEKSFIDDDGTRYEWNPEIKKFQPKYALEDMTYVPDEERIPSLEEILKQNMEGDNNEAAAVAVAAKEKKEEVK